MKKQANYRFSPTLLDTFIAYLNCSETYQKYWGNSENPTKTEQEYEQECFQKIFDRLNHIPLAWEDSEAADRGTAFNEIIDCIIHNRKSDKMQIASNKESRTITANYNNRNFQFPIALCREFSDYYKGAISQMHVSAILPTRYGTVELHGYIDELLNDKICDIKTTNQYNSGKYRQNMQHLVYPFCLTEMGMKIVDFEYNIAVIKYNRDTINYDTFTEHYAYSDHEKTKNFLRAICEQFIEFLIDTEFKQNK